MHTIVSIKQVPDTSNVRINPDTGTLIREGVPAIINPYDVHAIELAVRLKERFGGTVTAITMGPAAAAEALVECVEQGVDRGILVSDRKFAAADTLATSYVLGTTIEALAEEEPVDLLLFGLQAIDGDTAQVGPGVATRLGLPLISYALRVEDFDPEARTAVVHRKAEKGIEVLQTRLPALLTVEKDVAEVARAPLPNLIRAARYEPEQWSAAEPVPFDPTKIGIKGSPTIVGKAYTPPPKEPGEIVTLAERGLNETGVYVLDRIRAAGVVEQLGAALSAAEEAADTDQAGAHAQEDGGGS